MTPRWAESGGGDPTAVADDPRPPVGCEGEPEEVEGEVEAAGGGENPEVEGIEELLDVEEQRRGSGGRPRAPGGGDLSGGRLPPDHVGGGLGLSRAEDGGSRG